MLSSSGFQFLIPTKSIHFFRTGGLFGNTCPPKFPQFGTTHLETLFLTGNILMILLAEAISFSTIFVIQAFDAGVGSDFIDTILVLLSCALVLSTASVKFSSFIKTDDILLIFSSEILLPFFGCLETLKILFNLLLISA